MDPIFTQEKVRKLVNCHPHVTEEDVQKLYLSIGLDLERLFHPDVTFYEMDEIVHHMSKSRETQKLKGRKHVEAGPLLHVHSLHVQPNGDQENRPLAVCGKIRVKYQNITTGEPMQLDVYNRGAKDPEYISPSGGYLTLGWPDSDCKDYFDFWMPLHGTTIEVDLFLKNGNVVIPFVQENFLVGGTTEGDLEELTSKEFCTTHCSATLSYIAMPFAALCKVDVQLSSRDKGLVVNVAGKIVARYKNTCGNYKSEPCVLFYKQDGFEPINMEESLCMSRSWLGLPAYSSLEVELDLMDFNTNRKLIKKTVEIFAENKFCSSQHVVDVGDFVIDVDGGLFSWPHMGWNDLEEVKYYHKLSSSKIFKPRNYDQDGESKLIPFDLVEFYSLFIGYKKTGSPLKIFGTVEFSSDDNTQYLFKRPGSDGVEVEDSQNVLPLNDVYKGVEKFSTVELKVNLEDVGGKFQNRGFATYTLGSGYSNSFYNTQICSVFPGKEGFCALHYSLLSRACQAKIEIFFRINSVHSGVEKIYGSAITQYSNFDYSTKFKRDYFRSMLFKRTEKDSVRLKDNGRVPLSRCVVAVPMDSSLIIEVDFCGMSLKDHLSCTEMFKIGSSSFSTKTKDYVLDIKLTWSDGLHDGGNDSSVDKVLRENNLISTMGGSDLGEDTVNDMVNEVVGSLGLQDGWSESDKDKQKQADQRNGLSDLDGDKVLQYFWGNACLYEDVTVLMQVFGCQVVWFVTVPMHVFGCQVVWFVSLRQV